MRDAPGCAPRAACGIHPERPGARNVRPVPAPHSRARVRRGPEPPARRSVRARSPAPACLPGRGVQPEGGDAVSARPEEEATMVQEGSQVAIEYTLTLEDGTRADSNVGEEPLVYQQGAQQILPALEEALAGMEIGESREVTLPPEKGYGERDPQATQEVESSALPEGAAKVGTRLVSQDTEGNRRLVKVQEVKDATVVLDLNHPLAGETLHFDVKVVGIE